MARNCRTGVSIRTGGRGAAGPQGPMGPQGPIGPTGPVGPEGTGNTGPTGPTGPDGVGITGATLDGDNLVLIIDNQDGTTSEINVGDVRGLPGTAAERGATGATGPIGTTGIGFSISNTYRSNQTSTARCTIVGGVGGFLTDGVGVTHGEFKLTINDGVAPFTFQSRAVLQITENNLDDVSKAAVVGITGDEKLFVQLDNQSGTKSYSYIFSAPDRIIETEVSTDCSTGLNDNTTLTLPAPLYDFQIYL